MRSRTVVFLVAALALVGCAAKKSKNDAFHHWTRYYESRMGLPDRAIIVTGAKTPGGFCGELTMEPSIGRYGVEHHVVVYYDSGKFGCRPPWDVALHEACHRRMQHHLIGADLEAQGIDIEDEARECESWYRERDRERNR
jgi:hypothetical protein